MSRRWLIVLIPLTLPFFILPYSAATGGLRVDEAKTRMLLREDLVHLAVENTAGREVAARVRLELLDPVNNVLASAESDETIRSGSTTLVLPLRLLPPKAGGNAVGANQVLWYRLRYRVSPDTSADRAINMVENIIALSEITPDIFELQVAAPERAREGTLCRLHVRATHPVSSRPVGDVSVAGEIKFEEEQRNAVLKATGRTDAEGYATLDFNLPRRIKDGSGEIKVFGTLGDLMQEASHRIDVDHSARILLNTDKPLYQPGQVMHVRALIFDTSRRAMANAAAVLKISDAEGETVFRHLLKTSRFGIASADWTIPAGARLGGYTVTVDMNEGAYDNTARASVKISRYELPNFAVLVQPDREYYLPGQPAEVEVRADYLFGEPVKRGHVRVVRETERRWNFSAQKWETEEGEEVAGDLDAEGRFVAHVDLEDEQKGFTGSDDERYRDLTYAAYLTDPTTNRTEQRRFDLRLTKEAIHIYVGEINHDQAAGLPLQFYLSTFYADGTPASCEVAISEAAPAENSHHGGRTLRELPLQKVRTNRFGVARVKGAVVGRVEGESRTMTLILAARDRKGKSGRLQERFEVSRKTTIRVETDRTLYRAGDTLQARITANRPDLAVIVDVARDLQVVRSEIVRLTNGQALVTLPYNSDFRDRLTIAASAEEDTEQPRGSYYPGYVTGRRTVLYPRDRELKLDVRMGQDTYRPGEEGSADLTVRTPDGRAVESALGIVVLDKAVEERARTNQEFGAYGFYNNFHGFMYGYDNLSGITHRELERIDFHHGVPEGVELAAEVMLQNAGPAYGLNLSDRRNEYADNEREVFRPLTSTQLLPINSALYTDYVRSAQYPSDAQALRRVLSSYGINFDALHDPWGTAYRAAFSIDRSWDVAEIISAGPDKRFDTRDDFPVSRMSWPYFLKTGEKINRAIAEYHERTGEYIRDARTLKDELRRAGLDFDALRDRWGRPYRLDFGVTNTFFSVNLKSGGPDRLFDTSNAYATDDFSVWTTWSSYILETVVRMNVALAAYATATARFPTKEMELRDALRGSGISWESLRDAWGHPYYIDYRTEVRSVDRDGRSQDEGKSNPGRTPKIVPNTRQVSSLKLLSSGQDGRRGTSDDFLAATFTSTDYEQGERNQKQQWLASGSFPGEGGSIIGRALDPSGAAVAGARVIVTDIHSAELVILTNDEGVFHASRLAPGLYTVRVEQAGFKTIMIENVEVLAHRANIITANLEVGDVTAVVVVTDVAQIDQSSTAVSSNLNDQFYPSLRELQVKTGGFNPQYGQAQGGVVSIITKSGGEEEGAAVGQSPMSTPRLREYFPETLVWQPALETDVEGHARLSFKLADNITTWKMSVIGSTLDGEVGMAETEFRAFQPFFVEHNPPRVLTEGDEIELPVVLRNYMEKAQTVELEIKPESWFTLLGASEKHAVVVAARDAARETFRFRAISMVDEGRQRITASAEEANDAIEKPVSVHPDGQEVALTDSRILTDEVALEADIPEAAIDGATRAELKIYPNLMAHVVESIEGIIKRPYGCGEQTISSTYPSLLVLQAYKRMGGATPPALAQRYTYAGYERLLNYRAGGGGFSYWGGKNEADLALTAYALRFLKDARGFVAVDEDVIEGARGWLVKQQGADGSWAGAGSHGIAGGGGGEASLTAFIAHVLAMTDESGATGGGDAQSKPDASLARALAYLSSHVDKTNDPYLLATYALSTLNAGRRTEASRALTKLRALAKSEGEATHWTVEANTPFNGWGLAGQIETTALALQALARSRQMERPPVKEDGAGQATEGSAAQDERLMARGLAFLLRNKDRYGVWLSTQATINVLDALMATTGMGVDQGSGAEVEVSVNGRPAGSVSMKQGDPFESPRSVDISRFISSGRNRVELRRSSGSPQATVQLVATYWVPWAAQGAGGDSSLGHAPGNAAAAALRLKVAFDKTEARVRDEVTCSVTASRVGAGGYGMLLAEIGLPPGADVDRASLEKGMRTSNWSFSRYDILPDRLVVYLWPRTGVTSFEFKFRPRYGLAAQTAPSVLYDYYNPDARTTVAPVKFTVR